MEKLTEQEAEFFRKSNPSLYAKAIEAGSYTPVSAPSSTSPTRRPLTKWGSDPFSSAFDSAVNQATFHNTNLPTSGGAGDIVGTLAGAVARDVPGLAGTIAATSALAPALLPAAPFIYGFGSGLSDAYSARTHSGMSPIEALTQPSTYLDAASAGGAMYLPLLKGSGAIADVLKNAGVGLAQGAVTDIGGQVLDYGAGQRDNIDYNQTLDRALLSGAIQGGVSAAHGLDIPFISDRLREGSQARFDANTTSERPIGLSQLQEVPTTPLPTRQVLSGSILDEAGNPLSVGAPIEQINNPQEALQSVIQNSGLEHLMSPTTSTSALPEPTISQTAMIGPPSAEMNLSQRSQQFGQEDAAQMASDMTAKDAEHNNFAQWYLNSLAQIDPQVDPSNPALHQSVMEHLNSLGPESGTKMQQLENSVTDMKRAKLYDLMTNDSDATAQFEKYASLANGRPSKKAEAQMQEILNDFASKYGELYADALTEMRPMGVGVPKEGK